MKATFLPFSISVAAALCLAQPSIAQEKLLPTTYLPGKEYVLETKQQTEMDMSAVSGGGGGKTTIDVTIEMTITCEPHTESGQKKVTTRFSRMIMDMNSMGMKMSYDSAKEGSERTMLGQQGMGDLVDSEIVMILDEDDEVVELEGEEALADAQMLDKKQFEQLANPSVQLGIPAAGVAVGDAWENDLTMSLGGQVGDMTSELDLVYASDEQVGGADCAVIEYEGTAKIDLSALGQGAGNVKMENSNLEGVMKMDKELRFIREGSADMDFEMTMPNPTNPQQTLQVPATISQTFSLKSVNDI